MKKKKKAVPAEIKSVKLRKENMFQCTQTMKWKNDKDI
jgi:hypothetical protein